MKEQIIKRFRQILIAGGDYTSMTLAMRKVETLAKLENKTVAEILTEIKS